MGEAGWGCPNASLSIVFVGTKRMRAINKKYLKHDDLTDVLSFDLGEGLSEIIICPQVASAQAKTHHTSIEGEIILYVVHGILHLVGFDDHKPKDILHMRRMEEKLLVPNKL
jgi:probable rRNA maturation factor